MKGGKREKLKDRWCKEGRKEGTWMQGMEMGHPYRFQLIKSCEGERGACLWLNIKVVFPYGTPYPMHAYAYPIITNSHIGGSSTTLLFLFLKH